MRAMRSNTTESKTQSRRFIKRKRDTNILSKSERERAPFGCVWGMWNQWKNNFSTWTLWIPDGRCFGAQSQTCWPISTSVIMFQRSYWIGCVCKCFFRECSPFFLFRFGFFSCYCCYYYYCCRCCRCVRFYFSCFHLIAVNIMQQCKISSAWEKRSANHTENTTQRKTRRTHSNSNNNNSIKKQLEKLSTLCMSSFFFIHLSFCLFVCVLISFQLYRQSS